VSYRKDVKLPKASFIDAYLDDTVSYGFTKKSWKFQETEAIEDAFWTMDVFYEFFVKGNEDLEEWYAGGKYFKLDFITLPEEEEEEVVDEEEVEEEEEEVAP
jgi:hypothetical protein